jgi:TRAP-type transport system small permease protein
MLSRLTRLLSHAASICLVVMMGVTVVDVVGRWLFAIPIFGAFEVVGVMLVGTIFLALPETFLRDQHVTVDVIDNLVPAAAKRLLQVIAALL